MYLTYEEYTTLGGKMAETDFPRAEFKARKRLDYLTADRIQSMARVPEAVKYAMLEIIDADAAYGLSAQIESPLVASFSTDGYSESYGGAAEQSATAAQKLNESIRHLLTGETDDEGTPLMYRGVVR